MKPKQFIAEALASNTDECMIWPFSVRNSGYGAWSIRTNCIKTNYDAHRYVCQRAHGNQPGMEAAHHCGNKLCVNPRHIYWATHAANMEDAKRHLTLKGGGRYRQRFFDEEVTEIRTSNDSYRSLAERYETDVSYIGRIKRAA